MRRRRRPYALAVATTLSLALAACSGGDDKDAGTSTTSTTVESTTAPTTQPDVAAAADLVKIDEADYAYTVSGALKSGGTLEVSNKGKEFHMLGLGRFEEGKTLDDLKAALAREPATEEEDPTAGIIQQLGVPGNVMGPGQSAQITVPSFGPGRYALLCYINVEGEETPHFSKGMISELTVVDAKAPEPQATASYRAEKGKPIEGPASVKAGRQVLRIESTGEGAGDLEPGLTKLNPGTTPEQFNAAAKLFEEGPLPVGAPGKLPGAFVIGGFDYREARVVYLTVNLEAGGNYYLTANDTDDDDDPAVPDEILKLEVTP